MNKLIVSPSPHLNSEITTAKIMSLVLAALSPAMVAAVVFFGARAAALIAVCTASSVVCEYFCRRIMKREQTINDLSAAVTGVILALNLPVTVPYWMAGLGSFIAVVIVKQLFGGIGRNFANPAVTARIVLMVSFTGYMTDWAVPQYWQAEGTSCFGALYHTADIITGPTPLVSGNASLTSLFLGNTGGCIGETSAAALLAGGIYLMVKKVITPAVPAAYLGTVALLTLISGGNVPHSLMSGGLFLGAFFMATDYTTSPVTEKGKIIFGAGCGIITFVIRKYGSYPEGVSFSILLMNILTPYIDRISENIPFGSRSEKKEV
ncbi:RnfABCDGE type electron transport complex subunit D [Ruminococcus sp. HUN007]|uniref:RnfABCDGE type electron transport complex subunit D n=1 Tax=Ruminococcus sp. HUN007 TaxID=1514668 RepID=UPI0005D2ABC3|nr:RnfABCDGE type electron transport complex subunit D [Ruminococcus sp. HUN007]